MSIFFEHYHAKKQWYESLVPYSEINQDTMYYVTTLQTKITVGDIYDEHDIYTRSN